jgi:uncharacterized protein
MFFRSAAVVVLFLIQNLVAAAIEVPKLQDRVTDLAGVLNPGQISALDSQLQELEKTDSTQIAVLIIPSLEGESIEDYTIRVAEAWNLGQKKKDNGALLLVAIKDRKVRIEVGYGLESSLTDLQSNRIIRNEIAPRFRAGDYYGGINAGLTGIIQSVRGTYQGSPEEAGSRRSRSGSSPFGLIIMLLFPLLWILSKIGSRSGRGPRGFGGPFFWGGGGGFSDGGGGFGGGGGGFSGGGGGFGGGGSSGSW